MLAAAMLNTNTRLTHCLWVHLSKLTNTVYLWCLERWLSEEGRKAGSWIPFGSGPRMCLGYVFAMQEIKVHCMKRA